jgi:hypothetical protein
MNTPKETIADLMEPSIEKKLTAFNLVIKALEGLNRDQIARVLDAVKVLYVPDRDEWPY